MKDQLETTVEKMGNYNFVGRQMSLHNSTIREPMKNWTELKLVDDLKTNAEMEEVAKSQNFKPAKCLRV